MQLCQRQLRALPFHDERLSVEHRARFRTEFRAHLGGLSEEDSELAREVQSLIADGVVSAPSYEGVGSLLVLLSLAMGDDTYAQSDLAGLLTFEGVDKALVALHFPLSPTALRAEMKVLPALATLETGAGLFAVLDYWTRLLLQELQLTPVWWPAPVVHR